MELYDNNIDFENSVLIAEQVSGELRIINKELFDNISKTGYTTTGKNHVERTNKLTKEELRRQTSKIVERAILLVRQNNATIQDIVSAQDLPERFQAYYPRIRAEIESLERGGVQREGLQHELSKEQEGVSESKPSPPKEKSPAEPTGSSIPVSEMSAAEIDKELDTATGSHKDQLQKRLDEIEEYKDYQEGKIDRLKDRAAKARERSDSAYGRAGDATRGIEFGQPILVGHHSEGKHRAALKRRDAAMRKSIEEGDKADYYDERVKSAERDKVIRSNDPEAISKMNKKIADAVKSQEMMKAANKVIRDKKLSDFSKSTIATAATALNLSWVAEGANNPAVMICTRSSNCPRDKVCSFATRGEGWQVTWVDEIKQDILQDQEN